MSKSKNQLGLFDPASDIANKKIVIIGAGGVWSTTAYYLTQMWCNNVTMVDFDEVEIHNTASQFYSQEDIDKPKVDAMKENLLKFNGVDITAINDKYNSQQIEDAHLVICAVDDMNVRKQVVEDAYEMDIEHVIEARMSWENFMLFSFSPLIDIDRWMKYWYPPEEAEPEVCTMKSISYNTWMIGSFITKLTRDVFHWIPTPFIVRVDGIFGVVGEF